jgi:mannose-6-phosphate isomerase-like protein (cupin superfamily)
MRKMPAIAMVVAVISVVALTAHLTAQQTGRRTPPPTKEYSSSADVAALIAQAKSEHKEGQPLQSKPILTLAPINANLEYRTGVAPAAVHETEAEIFYVIDGSATMVTGGKLTGEKRLNPENLNGTGIENGTSRQIGKGDYIIVPEGVGDRGRGHQVYLRRWNRPG